MSRLIVEDLQMHLCSVCHSIPLLHNLQNLAIIGVIGVHLDGLSPENGENVS